jgi:hypothetical protein
LLYSKIEIISDLFYKGKAWLTVQRNVIWNPEQPKAHTSSYKNGFPQTIFHFYKFYS